MRTFERPLPRKPLASDANTVSTRSTFHSYAWFASVSACWILLLYHGTLKGAFLYDDLPQIVQNPALLSWQSVFTYFRHAVPFSGDYLTTGGSFYRPLLWVSLALDRRLWGLNATAFHATNLLLHFLNGLAVFSLVRRLRALPAASWGAGLIWLGLPINSEAVAWISGRHIELYALFVLMSVWLADNYARSRRNWSLACFFLSCLAAGLSYEAGVLALPLSLIYLFFRSNQDFKAERTRHVLIPLIAAGLSACLIDFWLRSIAEAHLPTGSIAVLASGAAFFKYLGWMFLPIHMSVERSTDAVANKFNVTTFLGLAGLIVLASVAVWFRRRLREVVFGVAWLALTLLPFCGLVPNYQGMAERYLYLPSIGLAIAVVLAISRLRNRTRSVSVGLAGIWLVWGALRTQSRAPDWKDEATLDAASLTATPKSAILLYNLALNKTQSGDIRGASALYEQAIAANPRYVPALLNAATLLRREGRYPDAIEKCERVIQIDPGSSEAWMDLGNIYGEAGSPEKAKAAYERATALDPKNVEAAINLGTAYQQSGDLVRAKHQYELAIELSPLKAAGYCNLGALLFQEGDIEGAVRMLNRAIEIDPSYPAAYFDLGVIYQARKMYTLSAEMYGKTLALDPEHQAARKNIEMVKREE